MKTIARLAALVTTLVPALAHAQVVYITTQRAAPYPALAQGTSLFPFGAFDSALNIPIGFSFTYYGETYDTVSVTENGALALQPACSRFNPTCDFDEFCNGAVCERGFFPGPQRTGFPSLQPPTRVIAPFWSSLYYDTGNNPLSEVRHATVGVAPNRELVVEWRNLRFDALGGSPLASRFTFQARLSEATGNVRFHYGAFTAGQDLNFIVGFIGIQSGLDFTAGAACNTLGCTATNLQQLQNQVIEIGRPTGPELTGSVRILQGAQPGQQARVAVTARNVGLSTTPVGFVADVYLGLTTPIVPARDTNLGRVTFGALAPGATATATLTAVIAPGQAIGRYFVGATIDATGAVPEATEQNNLVEAVDTMLVGADLTAQIDEFPSGEPGQGATIDARIVNYSTAIPSVAWRLFLSTDGTLDAGDTELARGAVAAPSGDEVSFRPGFTYPVVPAAYYQLLLVVDPADAVVEVDELNNVGASVPFILGPEVQPVGVEVPARTGPGEQVRLTALIDSLGAAQPSVPFQVWLSRDAGFSPATDTLIATAAGPVPAGRGASIVFTATVPAALAPGQYFVVLDVDPSNVVPELDEANNTWVSSERLTLTGPDVSSVALGSDPLAFRGLPFPVTATFENIGGQSVRNIRYSFHFSVNQLITVTDPTIHLGGPISLAPGERVVVTATATVRADFAPGRYYLGVIADTDGAVTEQDEGNNIRRNIQQVVVRDVAPDFFLSEVVAPRAAAPGERLTIQRLIENGGNAGGTGAYAILLVPVGGASADGVEIGRGMITLAASAAGEGVDTVRLPTNVPAQAYEVEYVLDPDGLVDELEERNNTLRAVATLTVEQPQLEILSKLLPVGVVGVPYDTALVAQGGVGAVSWRVIAGALPAGLSLEASGRLVGTPTAESQARFVVEASDGATVSARELQILVAAGQAELDLLTRALPSAYAGQLYEYPLVAVGGVQPYTWIADESLPAGFVLTSSGTLTGVAETAVGSRVITFTVQDARGDFVERPLAFRVLDGAEGVRFGDGALPDGVVDEVYEASVAVTGGEPPYAFSLGRGELPPGLRLEGSTVIGRPERAGTFTVELRVTDGRGNVDLALFIITISASGELRFVTTGLPAGVVGAPYTDEGGQTVQLRVLAPADSSSVAVGLVSGAVPPGLTLGPDGRISGTPSATGVFAFVAVVADAEGRSARAAYGIVVDGPAVLPPGPEPDSGCACSSQGGGGASGALWLLAAVGLGLWRRRGALAGLIALGALGAVSPPVAEAQRVPPPPLDGGVGPGTDAGSGGGLTSRYFFSTRSEPYAERSGGTPVTFASVDDDATLITLPFPFRLFEDDYSTASVGTNGYVSLVSDARSLGRSSFPDPNDPNGVIAAFWDDLYRPTVTTHVEGVAPSRVFVIQWANTERCCGGAQAFLNFQIHLFEGPAGRMELHYGAVTGPGQEQFNGAVGFEDATGARGFNLAQCAPNCSQADFAALGGTVLVALQDAGEDVFATRIAPRVQGIGRVYQGVPFPTTVSYASYHGEPIGPFVYRVYAVARGTTALTNPIYTSAPVTLGPYEARSDALELTLPLSTAPGRYQLALVVDADEAIAEPDENNNVVFTGSELIAAERGPNYSARGVVWQGRTPIAPGTQGTVDVAIGNFGNLDGSTRYRVVLSGNPVASLDDLELASGMTALPLLATTTVSVPVTVPAGVRAGVYWIGVLVDPDNTQVELSEIDNTAVSIPLEVRSGPLAITTTTLPTAYRGVEYATTLVAEGVGVESWAVTAGALPAGLTLSESGTIFGRPTTVERVTFTAQVTAPDGATATRELALEVRAGMGPLVIVTRTLLPGVVGQAYPPAAPGTPASAQQRIVSSGGAGAVTFALVGGGPEGLVLDPDGYLHGSTPQRGSYLLRVEARAGVEVVTAELPLVVLDAGRLTLVPQALPAADVGRGYVARLLAVGVVDPANVEFALVDGAGALPDGLSLSMAGTLTGTATQVGRFVFAARVTEAVGARVASDTASFELEVLPTAGFALTPSSLPDATVGVPYTATFEARLGRAPYTWTPIDARRLPRGLTATIVTESGVEKLRLAGTPEEVPTDTQIGDRTGGIATFQVSVTDAGGQVAEAAYALRVVVRAAPAPPPPEEGGCSCATTTTSGVQGLIGWLALALVLRASRRRRA
jgi:MYXO-CTERM domain-containing protein